MIKLLLGIILCAGSFLGCSPKSGKEINWIYIIPEQYEGWVAIQYDCNGGVPLEEINNVIEVHFGSDGMFCTSDSFSAWHGQLHAMDTRGNPIPVVYQPSEISGYALCCSQAIGMSYTEGERSFELSFEISWVGDMSHGWPDLDTFREAVHSPR